MNQSKTPPQKSPNMPMEMSLVDLVFHTLISWGKSDTVVNRAAVNPRIVTMSMAALV